MIFCIPNMQLLVTAANNQIPASGDIISTAGYALMLCKIGPEGRSIAEYIMQQVARITSCLESKAFITVQTIASRRCC